MASPWSRMLVVVSSIRCHGAAFQEPNVIYGLCARLPSVNFPNTKRLHCSWVSRRVTSFIGGTFMYEFMRNPCKNFQRNWIMFCFARTRQPIRPDVCHRWTIELCVAINRFVFKRNQEMKEKTLEKLFKCCWTRCRLCSIWSTHINLTHIDHGQHNDRYVSGKLSKASRLNVDLSSLVLSKCLAFCCFHLAICVFSACVCVCRQLLLHHVRVSTTLFVALNKCNKWCFTKL